MEAENWESVGPKVQELGAPVSKGRRWCPRSTRDSKYALPGFGGDCSTQALKEPGDAYPSPQLTISNANLFQKPVTDTPRNLFYQLPGHLLAQLS